MILILSTPRDYDTQNVIDWLKYKKAKYFRLNDEDIMSGEVLFNLNPLDIYNSYIEYNKGKIYFKDISIVWFRKFGFFLSYTDTFGKKSDIAKYISTEFSVIRNLIFKILENKKWLFKRDNMLSKLEILNLANECSLRIPNSLITSDKKQLKPFFEQNNFSIISKSIGDGRHVEFEEYIYPFYTQKINSIDHVTNKFSPSLFQAYIEKEYELRIFFLHNKFYTMVIFSQNNEKTKIDFRRYDKDRPNRKGTYQLPKCVESKLLNLMNKIGLNTGSIDMIKGLDGQYHFLEVNPSGQFGMTGVPCNYNLHEKVANYLIKN